jgi:hypothetical protein
MNCCPVGNVACSDVCHKIRPLMDADCLYLSYADAVPGNCRQHPGCGPATA